MHSQRKEKKNEKEKRRRRRARKKRIKLKSEIDSACKNPSPKILYAGVLGALLLHIVYSIKRCETSVASGIISCEERKRKKKTASLMHAIKFLIKIFRFNKRLWY